MVGVKKMVDATDNDIIISRYKKHTQRPANLWLERRIRAVAERYAGSQYRFQKSAIIDNLIDDVSSRNGRFLRPKSSSSFQVIDNQSTDLREYLGEKIRSKKVDSAKKIWRAKYNQGLQKYDWKAEHRKLSPENRKTFDNLHKDQRRIFEDLVNRDNAQYGYSR